MSLLALSTAKLAWMIGLGIGFWNRGSGVSPPSPPTLTLVSGVTDNTPNFTIVFGTTPVAGDVVRTYRSNNSDLSSPTIEDHTLTSGEASSSTNIQLITGAIADGTWYFAIKHGRGGSFSAISNTVTITIDATAPTITSNTSTSLAENATLLWTITTDENATIAIGGADAAQFELVSNPSSTTRNMRGASNKTWDFEIPADAGADNVYNITLTPTDAVGNVGAAQNFTMTVTNVAETITAFGFYGRAPMGWLALGR